jgi:endonuclease/exonuclease/phosphatase (EEP) superfamily protein YafD
MQAIRRICSLLVFLCSLWALSDTLLSLEYSWILFLFRVLAPLIAIVVLVLFAVRYICMRMCKQRLSRVGNALLTCALCVALAPVIRSLTFITTYTVRPPPDLPTVTLLNLNALGFRDLSSTVIKEIERREPDVVTIQEVNPALAQTLETRFSRTYQCRILKPADGSWGMGTLAKNPCTERTMSPVGSWVGPPIVINTTTSTGSPITVANFHAVHPHAGLFDGYSTIVGRTDLNLWQRLSQPIFDRQESVGFLLDTIGDPKNRNIIIAGDLNASMRNRIYATVRNAGYRDTWLDLRSALSGGTWPAPEFLGGFGLGWLLRIDFIFRSESLLPTEIELLPETLGSDHRGMFGRFALMM